MKSLLLVALGLLLIGSVANAAELSSEESLGGTPGVLNSGTSRLLLTQNATLDLNTSTIQCGNSLYSYVTESWTLRRFSLAWEFAITTPFEIQNVQWGVRRYACYDSILPAGSVQIPCNPADVFTVDVQLYALADDQPLTFAALGTPFASVADVVTEADNPISPSLGTPKTTVFPAGTCIDPYIDGSIYKDLVVALHGSGSETFLTPARFFPSGNTLGETAVSYLALPGCGLPEPVPPGSIGYPNNRLVLGVNGDYCAPPPATGACCNHATGACTVTAEADCVAPFSWLGADVPCNVQTCPIPVPAETKSWGQVKSLYR